jgi:hypothetical protein
VFLIFSVLYRFFNTVFIVVAVLVTAIAIGNLTAVSYEMAAEQRKIENLTKPLNFDMIREMDKDGDGVDKFEFVMGMLTQLE